MVWPRQLPASMFYANASAFDATKRIPDAPGRRRNRVQQTRLMTGPGQGTNRGGATVEAEDGGGWTDGIARCARYGVYPPPTACQGSSMLAHVGRCNTTMPSSSADGRVVVVIIIITGGQRS